MGPHADHACLSKQCLTEDGSATVYDLPVGATHCPMGHKRLRRLFNAINVVRGGDEDSRDMRRTSSSLAAKLDRLVEPAYERATASKRAAVNAPHQPGQRPAFAVPINRVGDAVSGFMGRAVPIRLGEAGTSRPAPSLAGDQAGPLAAVRGRPVRPQVVAADKGRSA